MIEEPFDQNIDFIAGQVSSKPLSVYGSDKHSLTTQSIYWQRQLFISNPMFLLANPKFKEQRKEEQHWTAVAVLVVCGCVVIYYTLQL